LLDVFSFYLNEIRSLKSSHRKPIKHFTNQGSYSRSAAEAGIYFYTMKDLFSRHVIQHPETQFKHMLIQKSKCLLEEIFVYFINGEYNTES